MVVAQLRDTLSIESLYRLVDIFEVGMVDLANISHTAALISPDDAVFQDLCLHTNTMAIFRVFLGENVDTMGTRCRRKVLEQCPKLSLFFYGDWLG